MDFFGYANFWSSWIGTRMGNSTNMNVSPCTRSADSFFIGLCGWYHNDRKVAEHEPMKKICRNQWIIGKYFGSIVIQKSSKSLWPKVAKIDLLHRSNHKTTDKFAIWEATLKIANMLLCPRCFICKWLVRFQICVTRFTVRIRIIHACFHFVDVQETFRSFSQQCTVWNSFAWRRFTNGRLTGASMWGMRVGNVIQ